MRKIKNHLSMVVHRGSKLAGEYEGDESYEQIIDGYENGIPNYRSE